METTAGSRDLQYARRWWTLSVLCLSLVMTSVANTSINVAVPTLVRGLHANAGELEWIVDAYSLVFAGLLLTAGSLGDRYGRKAALNLGLVIFGAASGLAALCHSADELIAARAVMGAGAALVMPATLSILAHVFPPKERARAIALWAGCAGAGGAGGSVISGWLLQHFWWGSIFLSNVAVVVVALAAGYFLIPPSARDGRTPLDPVGAFLSTCGLGVLIYAIIQAPDSGWVSAITAIGFTVAAGLLVAFACFEWRNQTPMLDLRFFKNPRFAAATTTITLIFFAMYGTNFILTQYLQLVLGYTPLQAGLRILPIPIVFMAAAPASARLVERYGQRTVVVGGLFVLAIGLTLVSQSGVTANYPHLFTGLSVTALGMGLTTAPSTAAIMESLPLGKAGVGSAVNDTTRELGGALGVAVLGSLLASRFRVGLAPALHALPAATRTGGGSLSGALATAATLLPPARRVLSASARHAYVNALDVTVLTAVVGITLAAGVVAFLLRPAGEVVTETVDPALEAA